jgi:hypothetical protein
MKEADSPNLDDGPNPAAMLAVTLQERNYHQWFSMRYFWGKMKGLRLLP